MVGDGRCWRERRHVGHVSTRDQGETVSSSGEGRKATGLTRAAPPRSGLVRERPTRVGLPAYPWPRPPALHREGVRKERRASTTRSWRYRLSNSPHDDTPKAPRPSFEEVAKGVHLPHSGHYLLLSGRTEASKQLDDETWRERGLRPARVLAAARFSAVLMCRPTPIADPPSFKQAVISSIKS